MNINWGMRITLLYSGFVVMMLSLVYMCTQQEFHLVTPAYYQAEKGVDQHMQRVANTRELAQSLELKLHKADQQLELIFPADFTQVAGELLFYRPQSAHDDVRVSLTPDGENKQQVATEALARGLWRVQINWQAEGTLYYTEETIYL